MGIARNSDGIHTTSSNKPSAGRTQSDWDSLKKLIASLPAHLSLSFGQDGLMKLLSSFKHLDHASYLRLSDLGVFRVLKPEHDRVDVGHIQSPEESQSAL